MITTKYRGVRITDGNFVYGDLYQGVAIKKIITPTGEYIIFSESVAKLVGYDEDGNEIYKSAGWLK